MLKRFQGLLLTPISRNFSRFITMRPTENTDNSSSPQVANNVKAIVDDGGPKLRVQLRNEHAKAPTRGSAKAAGYDIYSSQDTVILPKCRGLVDTGLSVHVPHGTYGRIAPRSGLAVKHFIDTGAGVVDEDYRGEIKVLLFNFGEEEFVIKKGDRIAQLVLERIITPDVLVLDTLEETERGEGRFGSTGK